MPLPIFRRCVVKYQGDFKIRKFSCLDQFLCMAFAQLTYRESLRDIEVCLRSQSKKLYHMGIRGKVSRSTLSEANEKRDWRIYAELAQTLIATARKLYSTETFLDELEETVYALDSTTIDLCLSVFPWASFRKTKSAIKLHTLLDLRGNIPTFIHISDGKLHDVNVLDIMALEAGAYYIMDRGYLDFKRLFLFNKTTTFFVTRAKFNTRFRRLYSHPVDKSTGLICDQTIVLTGVKKQKRISRQTPAHQVQRSKDAENPCFSNKQFHFASIDHCETIQKSLAGRIVFQMDQTTPQNQKVFRHICECSKISDLDCSLGLRARGNLEKEITTPRKSLHNFTDFKCNHIRKSFDLSANYRAGPHNRSTFH